MLKQHHVRRLALLAAAGSLVAGSLMALMPALAQGPAADFPNRPVRIIVSNPAGGGIDTVTRVVGDRLAVKLGQPVVIENRGGAGGNIGAEAVYTAAPDGYTLLASVPAALTTNIFMYKKLPFDPAKFEPVAVLGTYPNTLLVRNDFPAKTVQEFIAYVKANPGKVNYASQGIGTTSHLTAELYNSLAGARMVHVPYRGTAPALNDIVAGHVDVIFMQLSSALKLHEGKRARILAVDDREAPRHPQGYPDHDRGRYPELRLRHLATRSARRPERRRRSSPSSTRRSTTPWTILRPRSGSPISRSSRSAAAPPTCAS